MSHTGRSSPWPCPVHFTRSAWVPGNRTLVDVICRHEPGLRQTLLVVVDDGLGTAQPALLSQIETYVQAHAEVLSLACRPVLVPGGEEAKNDLAHAFDLLRRIHDGGLGRDTVVVAIGGGAVLDMVSFVAGVAWRGLRVVRMPTTVMAQARSAAASENGVNLFGRKDFIGASTTPFAVVTDTDALATLSCRDSIAGLAEVVRIALTRGASLYRHIESNICDIVTRDREVLARIVQRAAELQVDGAGGGFEADDRARPIELGGWAAGALESLTEGRLRYGEALGIGMALDLAYCVDRGYLAQATCDSVLRLLEALGLRLWDEVMDWRTARAGCGMIEELQDLRSRTGRDFGAVLLRGIGNSVHVKDVDESAVARAIAALGARGRMRHAASARAPATPR